MCRLPAINRKYSLRECKNPPGLVFGVRENYFAVGKPFSASETVFGASGNIFRRPEKHRTQDYAFPDDGIYFRTLGKFYKCASVCSAKCKQPAQEH